MNRYGRHSSGYMRPDGSRAHLKEQRILLAGFLLMLVSFILLLAFPGTVWSLMGILLIPTPLIVAWLITN